MDTQLIAHDREVYDIAWGGLGVFATVSADGSVRVFDLRWVQRQRVRPGGSATRHRNAGHCVSFGLGDGLLGLPDAQRPAQQRPCVGL